ncbi:MAG: 30S ribosomal protein S13 [Candidatus ainarchaeum sp.]|nr:30S ribosomal protein S13 [Candidatus ainarchaeum sp.]MDD5096616.1 30S ribosomal protein S13 [Candidatus ainarchaeum sp.]
MGGKKKISKKNPEAAKGEVKVEEKKKAKPAAPRKEEQLEPGMRGIVRIAGKDIKGGVKLMKGLLRVRGVSHTTSKIFANIISEELGITPNEKVGKLSDEQIEKVDKILTSIHTRNVPAYLLNRRKDPDTGKDVHVIMNDLAFTQRQDIEREKKLYTWKGYRHSYGKKVRGQRTRNTGRKGMALGVMRKTILAAAQAAKAPSGKPGAPAAGAPAAGAAPAAKEAKK